MNEKDKLIRDNMALIKSSVSFYAKNYDSGKKNDFFSAALLGATKALNGFDKKRGKFKAFLRKCVTNELNNEVGRIKRFDREDFSNELEEEVTSSPWMEEEILNPEEMVLRKESI